jgi:spore photoproduct lyase family protein
MLALDQPTPALEGAPRAPFAATPMKPGLFDIQTIYMEPAVETYERGRQVLARFPGATRVTVPSHHMIPNLYGNEGNAEDWLRIKLNTLVLGVKKSMAMRPNTRSSNFIAPSTSNGCAMACAYCYVPRRKGYANPITVFVNIEQICAALKRHAAKQGAKTAPDQADPSLWVYDLGENGDLSVDALVSDNVADLVRTFRDIPNAKGSFATKFVNRQLLDYDPQGKTRIRFSLMPQKVAKVVDVRTSPIADRIAAIDEFVRAGYEVHINLSPVIVYDGWETDYLELLDTLDQRLSPDAKAQLKAEIIFLTHNEALHGVNMQWHPKAEHWLWRPELQQKKLSQNGMWNLRYKVHDKRGYLETLTQMMARVLPYCEVRYAF